VAALAAWIGLHAVVVAAFATLHAGGRRRSGTPA
jgi:hypothetical protein